MFRSSYTMTPLPPLLKHHRTHASQISLTKKIMGLQLTNDFFYLTPMRYFFRP